MPASQPPFFSIGTQVVTLTDLHDAAGNTRHAGAVGIAALREGAIQVRLTEHREELLAIKRGAMAWEDVNAWRLDLHRTFDAAFAATRLPARPDYARVNAFLLRARRSAL